ncbi:MAG: type II toxin-antitoxin system HicB family antitoxin [Spirochaetales bacterium]|nr:type II toxin-antitoxin system HicB family antitoxin [Spirochaetales bacterium]
MKNEYSFVSVFEYDDDGINVTFPDLPGCFSCAAPGDTDTALKNAREALGLHLFGMEQDGEAIPEPTPISALELKKNQAFALVSVFMPSVRAAVRTSFVKKTVSLPAWLAAAADERHVNCSKVFQDALMAYMNMNTLSL